MEPVLAALNDVDLQWTAHIDSIWRDAPSDIPAMQQTGRDQIRKRISALDAAKTSDSPLGVPLLGQGGAGKTHLLSAIRREVIESGHYFVLVDMTDVREFWETILLGYIRSLEQPLGNTPQATVLLDRLSKRFAGAPSLKELASARPPRLINQTNSLIQSVTSEFRAEIREHQDVLRALVLFASNDFEIQECGYQWLQALGIGDDDGFRHGFKQAQKRPEQIVRGLSWLMSVTGSTVVALDQLDAIVAEHNLASSAEKDAELSPRQQASLAIIQGIAGGLSALRDVTRKTLTIVSSLEATWSILDRRSSVTMRDRFEPALLLKPLNDTSTIRRLIELRLERAYREHGYEPPYASFPFGASFFETRLGASPREVLKACHEHRQSCLLVGRVSELGERVLITDPPPSNQDIQERFEELIVEVDVGPLLEQADEEALDRLLEAGCEALIEENPLPHYMDALIDRDFAATGSFEPLHARLRIVDRAANDRERHYAFRFLEKSHHIAFQSRLKAAMTSAGIDRDLEFRRLTLFRSRPLPTGRLSDQLVRELKDRGGNFLVPGERELSVLAAVKDLLSSKDQMAARARDWLRTARPVSQLALFRDAVDFLFGRSEPDGQPPKLPKVAVATPSDRQERGSVTPETPAQEEVTRWPAEIALGFKMTAGVRGDAFSIPLDNLTKHAVVLAGAGSGKTVLLRRLIEEAALAGIPSIVIDGANDLSRLGDAWPERPDSFAEEDNRKAAAYGKLAEVVVWSPGFERGNPLRLEALPDFSSVADDADELNAALDMARSSLEPVAIGARADKVRQGVLGAALRYFAQVGGGNLERLIAVLSELPPEANSGYDKAEKLAREAADRLRAEVETNPLWRGGGAKLDPELLLTSKASDKVRVSVVNLCGLPDLPMQQQFMNQLSMTLFSWIKKHPARGRALQGLLVIDEARDFIPSGKSVPGKDNIIRLVAQARKYGLGIVFATQAPKSIDHNVIANCSTQFYGRQNSPAAIDTVKEQLQQRGASGSDVAKLPRGIFYAFTEGLTAPVKLSTPLCLSHHPSSPPSEEDVLARAERSRALA